MTLTYKLWGIYHLNRLDGPVLIAVPEPLLTEFGIHHRLESCGKSRLGSVVLGGVLGPVELENWNTTLQSMMNAKLSMHRLHCHENGLIKTIQKIYRAPTDFRPLRHIFVHFCGLPTAFMLH